MTAETSVGEKNTAGARQPGIKLQLHHQPSNGNNPRASRRGLYWDQRVPHRLSVFNSAQYTVSAQMMLVLVTQPKYRPRDLLSSAIARITRAVTDPCMCLDSTKLCSPLRFSPEAVPTHTGPATLCVPSAARGHTHSFQSLQNRA